MPMLLRSFVRKSSLLLSLESSLERGLYSLELLVEDEL
jgi:hypothetical protein